MITYEVDTLATNCDGRGRLVASSNVRIFLCGDVMTGRGVDQILPHSCDPRIFEPYVRDARQYVQLAETAHGPIPRHADYAYVWGYALDQFMRYLPHARIINLETSVTTSDEYWPGKGINYRMHPSNVPSLTAAKVDCCVLANNHVLDWGERGLVETLATLQHAGIRTAGAGTDAQTAASPAIVQLGTLGRIIVFAWGSPTSGVPQAWAARPTRAGVNWLADLSIETVKSIRDHIDATCEDGDLVIASIHWGGNWGYDIPSEQITFARMLIDEAGVHVVHGHSSHHPKAIEVYQKRPILYGCGDFLNDYEGIGGHETFRGDLALMYFLEMDPVTKTLARLRLVPTCTRRFQIQPASASDRDWLARMLTREGKKTGTSVLPNPDGTLELFWSA